MDLNAIKADIHSLVEKQFDPLVLSDILNILEDAGIDLALKNKLSARVLNAEENIRTGKVFDISEAHKRLKTDKL